MRQEQYEPEDENGGGGKKILKVIIPLILVLAIGVGIGIGLIMKNKGQQGADQQEAAASQEAQAEVGAETQETIETGAALQEGEEAASDGTQETEGADAQTSEVTMQETTPDEVTMNVQENYHMVAIDPGHQAQGDNTPEPIGPGASETKARVASGTQGVVTGIPENQLTLEVSLMLRDELEKRGYLVIMARETADVNISNAERALLANDSGAEIFVRIHANGAESSASNGTLTMCMTPNNPYNANLYPQSRLLSDLILSNMVDMMGSANLGVLEVDNMSGLNWCEIPVTIVEMGFMTNPEEDQKMATQEYRQSIVTGIANGIDAYFASQE